MELLRLTDGSRNMKEEMEEMGVLLVARPSDLKHQFSGLYSDCSRLHKNHCMFQSDKDLESAPRCPKEPLGFVLKDAQEMHHVPSE